MKSRIEEALNIANRYGSTDGGHHKAWVIDQMVRCLACDYDEWVKKHCKGEEGENTYSWDIGIAP